MAALSPALKQSSRVHAVRGEGCYLYDRSGRRYLDFTSGIGVVSTGHCHPHVVAAVQAQAAQLIHGQYTTVLHPRLAELGERLGEVLPPTLDSLFFASAGTEAVEAAVRLARQATGRSNVVVFQGSFHGRTALSLAMTTSKSAYRAGVQPLPAAIFVAPFPLRCGGMTESEACAGALAGLDELLATQTHPDETAAMVIEPVLGEGGYVPAPEGFLGGVAERCAAIGALFVADEVQTGFGRTGAFWGFEHSQVSPDVVISAKGLASGFPLSMFAASHDLMAMAWPGSQGGTYGGNAVACAASIATVEVIQREALVENAARMGEKLHEGLDELARSSAAVVDVRGRGLMVGMAFGGADPGAAARAVIDRAESKGLLLLPCGPGGSVVRWIPPLVVSGAQIQTGIEMFSEALAEVDQAF